VALAPAGESNVVAAVGALLAEPTLSMVRPAWLRPKRAEPPRNRGVHRSRRERSRTQTTPSVLAGSAATRSTCRNMSERLGCQVQLRHQLVEMPAQTGLHARPLRDQVFSAVDEPLHPSSLTTEPCDGEIVIAPGRPGNGLTVHRVGLGRSLAGPELIASAGSDAGSLVACRRSTRSALGVPCCAVSPGSRTSS
jgi:hypothetical protein